MSEPLVGCRDKRILECKDPKVISDICDGEYFKKHALFLNDKSAVQLLLYQDGIEISNTMGSSRKKYKLVVFYLSLGNLPPWCRTQAKSIPLVLLIKEKDWKYFGSKAVLERLIKDLKKLEIEGLSVCGKVLKVGLLFVLGDNLGSHELGGYVQNFSTSMFFCRYCEIERPMMLQNIHVAPSRTVQSYEDCVLEDTNNKGIDFSCELNQLLYFHAAEALPPCKDHDWSEGVIQYDVPLVIFHFSDKVSVETINRKFYSYKFEGNDALDRPGTVPDCLQKSKLEARNMERLKSPQNPLGGPIPKRAKGVRLGGHAVQNWVLLRFLPLVIGEYITNKEDPVWQMLLKLVEILRIISAPKVSKSAATIAADLIFEYNDLRCSIFREIPLRPKHHFITHNPEHILKYGPLPRVSTLCFERKHPFIKATAIAANNKINVTYTISLQFQLMQALKLSEGLFDSGPIMNTARQINELFLSESLVKKLKRKLGITSLNNLVLGSSVTFRNQCYSEGMFVVIEQEMPLLVCEIHEIFLQGQDVILAGLKHVAVVDLELQVHRLHPTTEFECVLAKDLPDYEPYPAYHCPDGGKCLVLKYLSYRMHLLATVGIFGFENCWCTDQF